MSVQFDVDIEERLSWPVEADRRRLSLRLATDQRDWSRQERQTGATIFHSWDWLSWIAPLLDCRFVPLLVQQGGVTIGLAPMLVRQYAFCFTANIVPFPYLGPVVPPESLTETAVLLKRWALRHRVLSFELAVHPTAAPGAGRFAAAGYQERSEPTYLVDLQRNSTSDVFGSLSSDVRGAVRRSAKHGVVVRPSTPDELRNVLPDLHDETLSEQKSYSRVLGQGLARGPLPFSARCTTAEVDGRPVGLSIALGGPTAHGWLGGVFRAEQRTQANSALVWDALQWAHAEGQPWLDMGGAPDAGIAAYKRKYKPLVRDHPVATWQAPGFAAAQRLRAVVAGGVG